MMVMVGILNSDRRKSFSLIELLVAIAVIVILISLLQPSLNKALEFSRATQCSSKLKQISMVMSVYASDYADRYPFVYGAYNAPAPFTAYNYSRYTWDDFLGREHDGRNLTDVVASSGHVRLSEVGREQLEQNLYGCPSDDMGNRGRVEDENFIPRSYAMNTYRGGYDNPSPHAGLSGGHQQFTMQGGVRTYPKFWSKSIRDITLPNQTIMLAEVPSLGKLGRMSTAGASASSQLYNWGRPSMGELENNQYHFGGYNYAMCDGSVLNMLVADTELNNSRLWQTEP